MIIVPDNYSKVEDGKYWYELDDGVYLVVVPTDKPSDKKDDIVKSMNIFLKRENHKVQLMQDC